MADSSIDTCTLEAAASAKEEAVVDVAPTVAVDAADATLRIVSPPPLQSGTATSAIADVGAPSSPTSPTSPSAHWRQGLTPFVGKKVEGGTVPLVSRGKRSHLKQFYAQQNELIERYEDAEASVQARLTGVPRATDDDVDHRPAIKCAINTAFVVNVILFLIQLFAAIWSGSLAIVASAVESSLDILSTTVIVCASRIGARKNKYKYPVGKATRVEPLSIVIFAAVMATAALELAIQGITRIVEVESGGSKEVKVDGLMYGIVAGCLFTKFLLWVQCWRLRNQAGTMKALALDHLNDIITNSFTLTILLLISHFDKLWWFDPSAAIVLGLRIMYSWVNEAKEHLQQLSGRVADKQQLSELTYLAMNHDERVAQVDTVRAYYFGEKLLVELDIVLPEAMPLREAHDIGESLQREIEKRPDVERAYVHLDYETGHKEDDEHMVSWK